MYKSILTIHISDFFFFNDHSHRDTVGAKSYSYKLLSAKFVCNVVVVGVVFKIFFI